MNQPENARPLERHQFRPLHDSEPFAKERLILGKLSWTERCDMQRVRHIGSC